MAKKNNYQQTINTPAAPRFLLQPMQYSWAHLENRLWRNENENKLQ